MYGNKINSFSVDDHALSLLENLLHWDPNKRLKAREALSHPYFTSEPLPCDPLDLP
jgi:serine/threonine protein kinase